MAETELKIIKAESSNIPILKILVEEYWRDIEVKYRPENERKITLGNLKSTLEYGYPYYQPGYSLDQSDMVFLAYLRDQVIGFVSFCIHREKNQLIIYDFMIRQEYQGKGFGAGLMEFVINKSKDLKLDQIELWVDDVNIAAKKLYQKFGFKFQNIEFLDWSDDEGNLVLQTKSERWRFEISKTNKEKVLENKTKQN